MVQVHPGEPTPKQAYFLLLFSPGSLLLLLPLLFFNLGGSTGPVRVLASPAVSHAWPKLDSCPAHPALGVGHRLVAWA